MADLEARQYDELDKVLAAQPGLKAPGSTRTNVMARIAALPQPVTVSLVAKYPVPVLTYPTAGVPSSLVALELAIEESEKVERQQRRLLVGFIFAGAWAGLCLFVLWGLWPAISNLFFGPSSDPEMAARLAALQSAWNNVTGFVGDFFTTYAALLPTVISAAVGLALMTALLFGNNYRRNNLSTQ